MLVVKRLLPSSSSSSSSSSLRTVNTTENILSNRRRLKASTASIDALIGTRRCSRLKDGAVADAIDDDVVDVDVDYVQVHARLNKHITALTITTFVFGELLIRTVHAGEAYAASEIRTNYLAAGINSYLEREYEDLKYAGVLSVDVGTCDKRECVRIEYDAEKINFERIMRVYFKHFDPNNALRGQFSEIGERYTPAIYVNDDNEKELVIESLNKLQASNVFGGVKQKLQEDWVANIPILNSPPIAYETELDESKRNVLKLNPKSLEKQTKARDAQFDQLWGFVQFCFEKVCGYVRFAPSCQKECQEVFPEFLSRNSGVPELAGDIKITGGTFKQ
jgi:hypothetical protein